MLLIFESTTFEKKSIQIHYLKAFQVEFNLNGSDFTITTSSSLQAYSSNAKTKQLFRFCVHFSMRKIWRH